ncbi:hypothetical protein [Streptomyces sp. P17]|uniref:hypothetical protein n=1 Tax=Streptomyces sp. P17 TaxID=3074716 RepID=UPI0028F3FCE3|nr:hypothetical protein [Streptomyces sp. P17]MDT9696807.1 hypothetical protein [Streptomyces sp. P17]
MGALRRLHALAQGVRLGQGGRAGLSVLDALTEMLEAAGLHADAAHLCWTVALGAVARGRPDEHRWDRLVRVCEAGPGRLPSAYDMPVNLNRAHARAAALAVARSLRVRGTPVSGLLAVALVRAGGLATAWEAHWRQELDALRGHCDPDTAMEALFVDTG